MLIFISCSKKDTSQPAATPPTANFNYSISKAFAPCEVIFSNSSLNASGYNWDFGDNNTSSQTNPTNFYLKGGTYTVKLKAINYEGSNTITKIITIPNAASKLQIDRITLGSLATVPTGNFDFYFRVINSNSQEVWKSGLIRDFNSTKFPTLFNLTQLITLLNLSLDYQVEVWRVGLLTDTRLGFAPLFPRLYNTGTSAYPSLITIPSTLNGTGMTFGVTWLQ